MFCPSCGKIIPEGAGFCPSCGMKAIMPDNMSAQGASNNAVIVEKRNEPLNRDRKKGDARVNDGEKTHIKRSIGVIAVCVLIILIISTSAVGAYYLWYIPSTDKANFELIKNGFLGEYKNITVSDAFYNFYAEKGYNLAIWSGQSDGVISRTAILEFAKNEEENAPIKIVFVVRDAQHFTVESITDPEYKLSKQTDLTSYLNHIFYFESKYIISRDQELALLEILGTTPTNAVLYGCGAKANAGIEELFATFGATETRVTTLVQLELENRLADLRAENFE